ncbi:hypothetical protein [Acetobacter cerevisiae]|uniref:hypothetical protein n=1 Tax=Acetobacter cerevisiae TaxID=178900 RepID=UPI00209CF19F|nr:hypothetical protein [Acetobacter cerevisiae]MCP1271254.1 hypothetical protein [Acetobacter cerevisiae]MCP1279208.1 hypothetical protein [Acetobacter cerevisiae]
MTQKTKLEIIGEYRKDHPGPFCTRDGRPVRVLCSDMQNEYSIVAVVLDKDGKETVSTFLDGGRFSKSCVDQGRDLMCAREVPVQREFWLNEFKRGDGTFDVSQAHDTELQAIKEKHQLKCWNWTHTIHVREVLPGEGA